MAGASVKGDVAPVPVTAIVTACDRVEQTLATLTAITQCAPPPDELLIYVDGNSADIVGAVHAAHPSARILGAEQRVGPGGGRNVMIAAASQPLVASFDDDSRPIDRDYFARVESVFAQVPEASVVGAHVYHQHETVLPDARTAQWVADFSGGACAYRREHFLRTGGYVPLEAAYGMEEVDMALRLHALGLRILQTPWLRVFHDTDLARHADPVVTAASVSNIALLTYLRYPVVLWGLGLAQCARRIWWCATHGRRRGLLQGITAIPALLRAHAPARRLVSAAAVRSYLRLRRRPVALSPEIR